MTEEMLSEKEAAIAIGFSSETLRQWRRRGGGPRFFTIGRSIRYRRSDVEAWLSARSLRSRVHPKSRG